MVAEVCGTSEPPRNEGVSGKGIWEAEVLLGVDVPRDIVDIEIDRSVEWGDPELSSVVGRGGTTGKSIVAAT